MDFHGAFVWLFFYGAVKGAKEALRGEGDTVTEFENNSEEKPKLLALVIIENNEGSEEVDPSMEIEAPMVPWVENSQIMLPWIENESKDVEDETSGESNSDEYPDSETESGTDSESNYYHEDDYIKDKIKNEMEMKSLEPLRKKKWKSCKKTASKLCRKSCIGSYKQACREEKCKKKFKKILKKLCKRNCKDFFD